MKLLSKILSIILLLGTIVLIIPKTISMFGWLKSGVISGYFYIIFPFNLMLFIMAFLSTYSFKKTSENSVDRTNSLIINNLIGLILLVLCYYINS